jgi:hypothetical protein
MNPAVRSQKLFSSQRTRREGGTHQSAWPSRPTAAPQALEMPLLPAKYGHLTDVRSRSLSQ